MLPDKLNKIFIQFWLKIGDYEYNINKFKEFLNNIEYFNPSKYWDKFLDVDKIHISNFKIKKMMKKNLNKDYSNEEINYCLSDIAHFKDNKISKIDLIIFFKTNNSKEEINDNFDFQIDKENEFKIDYSIAKIFDIYISMLKEKLAYLKYFDELEDYNSLDFFKEINMTHNYFLSEDDILNFFFKNNINVEKEIPKFILLALTINNKTDLNSFSFYFNYDPYLYNNKRFNHPEIDNLVNDNNFYLNWEMEIKKLKNLKFKIGQTEENIKFDYIKNKKKLKKNINKKINNNFNNKKINKIKTNYNEKITNDVEKINMFEDFSIFLKEIVKLEKKLISYKIDLILRWDFNPYEIFYYINYNMKDIITLNEFIPFIENDLGILMEKKNYIKLAKIFSKNKETINENDFICFFGINDYKKLLEDKKNVKNIDSLSNLTSKTKILFQNLLIKTIESEIIKINLCNLYNFNSKLIFNQLKIYKKEINIDNFERFFKELNYEFSKEDIHIIFKKISLNNSKLSYLNLSNFIKKN